MNAFIAALRQEISNSELALLLAQRTDDQAAISMHRARLLDLCDRGARNNVDAAAWLTVELDMAGTGGW